MWLGSTIRDAEEIERLRAALGECVMVLDCKEMAGVWGFLYTHGFTYAGPTIDMKKMREILDQQITPER